MAKILLVEDGPEQRKLYGATLRNQGHEVVAVRGGRAALQAIRSASYDIIVFGAGLWEDGRREFFEKLMGPEMNIPLVIKATTWEKMNNVALNATGPSGDVTSDVQDRDSQVWQFLNSD